MSRNPLMLWDDHWQLDGDLVRCRTCQRGCHVAHAHEAFQHASKCQGDMGELQPWKALLGILHKQIIAALNNSQDASDAR